MFAVSASLDHDCGPDCGCCDHYHHPEPQENNESATSSDYVFLGGKWGDSNVFGTTGQVVTWSLAGTVFDKFIGANSVDFSTFLNFDHVAALKEAFAAWSAISGIQFVQVADDGSTFNDVTVDSNNYIIDALTSKGGAGDIRINAGLIDGASNTLAYAFGPGNLDNENDYEFRGNMTFDASEGAFWTYASFVTVAMHEIGHAIGLDHTAVANSLMNPIYNPSVPNLQADDISGAQAIYGTNINSENTLNLKTDTPTVLMESYDGLIVEGSNNGDFFLGSLGGQTIDGNNGNDLVAGDAFEAGYAMQDSQDVYRLYITALGRAPDTEGLIQWTFNLATGQATLDDIVNGFVDSAEFTGGVGLLSNSDFVKHLYQNALGRNPDAAGLNAWVSLLDGGATKASIILGFSQSLEAQAIYDDTGRAFIEANSASHTGDDAYRIYQVILDRDPDEAGLVGWSYSLANNGSITATVDGFINSAEFQTTNSAITDGQFVTLLYQNAFGRAPDLAGYNAWVNLLENGTTKAEVAVGFIQSDEMKNVSDLNYKTWVRAQGIDDTISGGVGDDSLAGGILSDMFEFNVSEIGNDTVGDLEAWDFLSFTGFGFTQGSDVRSLLTQNGDNMHFSHSSGVNITFLDTTINDFTDDMFMFA